MTIREFAQNLQKIYDDMGKTFGDFQSSTQLSCLPGCGKCCNNPQVEASVSEMLPLALKLYDEGKLLEWLDRLNNSTQSHCLMYQAESADGAKGKCGVYHERPSLCRMFGVAGYYNKHQQVTLSVCRLIKDEYPQLAQDKTAAAHELNPPMMVTWSYRLAQLDPALIQDRLPINQALKLALEKVALYAQYHEEH
jgi:Fe-S-cluster containining protein